MWGLGHVCGLEGVNHVCSRACWGSSKWDLGHVGGSSRYGDLGFVCWGEGVGDLRGLWVVAPELVCFCFCICICICCLFPPNVYSALLNATFFTHI